MPKGLLSLSEGLVCVFIFQYVCVRVHMGRHLLRVDTYALCGCVWRVFGKVQ